MDAFTILSYNLADYGQTLYYYAMLPALGLYVGAAVAKFAADIGVKVRR